MGRKPKVREEKFNEDLNFQNDYNDDDLEEVEEEESLDDELDFDNSHYRELDSISDEDWEN